MAYMDLLVIGAGYVGLVTGACLAAVGHSVTCVDINREKIEKLKQGILPIYEPGLEEIVKTNLHSQRLKFSTELAPHLASATVCFVCVDTPVSPNGQANLHYIYEVANALAQQIQDYHIIVLKSTVPVGTSAQVKQLILAKLTERAVSCEFDLVSNPEFLKEGNAVNDFMKPDRVILGAASEKPLITMRKIYAPFMLSHDRILEMDNASAEMAKYAANAMLATRISFMNELAGLCELTGADINEVRLAIGSDKRIGYSFLYAGAGFGGSCFPKDLKALQATGRQMGHPLSIIEAVDQVNTKQKKILSKKIKTYFSSFDRLDRSLEGKTIGLLGLSFKPDTDDMREAASLTLIDDLLQAGCQLRVYDPIAMENAKKYLGSTLFITWCTDELEVAWQADALVLVTEWRQFRYLNFSAILANMRGRAFFDGRNQYSAQEMTAQGFDYINIGQASTQSLLTMASMTN